MNVLNATGNFCRFLAGRKDGNIRLFFEEIQKFGKIFLECPIRQVRSNHVILCLIEEITKGLF